MNKFRPTFWSLAFPVGIAFYSAFFLVKLYRHGFGINTGCMLGWSFIAGIALGGVLPLLLSFALKTDTRDYFLPRLIIFLSAFVVVALAKEFAAMPRGGTVLIYALDAAINAIFFFRIQRTSFKEWLVIFLSTPAIYMMLYYILLDNDIQNVLI